MIPNNIKLTERVQALINEAITANPNDDVFTLTIKVKLKLPELNEPATAHMSDESLMSWIHNTQEKETPTMAKPTDNTTKNNTTKKKTTKKKTRKSKKLGNVPQEEYHQEEHYQEAKTRKSKKLSNVPEEVLAPFTNPQETAVPSASRPNDTGIGRPMQSVQGVAPSGISEADLDRAEKEAEATANNNTNQETTPMTDPTDNTDNNTSNIDNSVDTSVQEDNVNTDNTDNTDNTQSVKTHVEIFDMLNDQLKGHRFIRRTLVHQDDSQTPMEVGVGVVHQVLATIARDERIALASLLTTHVGGDQSLKEYRLSGHGDPLTADCLISLTPKKRFLGLSKQTNVQVHASLTPTLEAMMASYNQENVVKNSNNNSENSEQTPNWFNRTRTHMADGLGSAKERMSDANIGERMTRVAKTAGSWIGNAALSVAERIIENLGLAARWTLVSFYGLWYYVIVMMAIGNGASLGVALMVGLYVMAIWTLKTFAWILAWFVALDFAFLGYDKLKAAIAEWRLATEVANATV